MLIAISAIKQGVDCQRFVRKSFEVAQNW